MASRGLPNLSSNSLVVSEKCFYIHVAVQKSSLTFGAYIKPCLARLNISCMYYNFSL